MSVIVKHHVSAVNVLNRVLDIYSNIILKLSEYDKLQFRYSGGY